MRFNFGPSFAARRKRRKDVKTKFRQQWHKKFALFPKRIDSETVICLESYWCRGTRHKGGFLDLDIVWKWHYRVIDDAEVLKELFVGKDKK